MPRPDKWTPAKLTPAQRLEVRDAYEEYILSTPYPIMAGFVSTDEVALRYKVTQQNLSDWNEMRELRTLATAKGEAYLVQKGLVGGIDKTMSIFLLKQPRYGYRDRSEQDITTGGERIVFNNYVPRPKTTKNAK